MDILLVQPYEDYEYVYYDLLNEIQDVIQHNPVDLIVFPEGFMYLETSSERFYKVRELNKYFETPVIVGFGTEVGSQEAIYVNMAATDEETVTNFYIKHSTAEKVLFDFKLEDDFRAQVYKPIILKGKKIQMYICHDMYYPLITERLEREGLDILINLTGGNVSMSKWCNILKGRSIELGIPVLCTMANRINETQPSDRIAYRDGKRLHPRLTRGNSKTDHSLSIFSTDETRIIKESPPYYSDKNYNQFTVGLDKSADCIIHLSEQNVSFHLEEVSDYETSIRLLKQGQTVHVHVANIENLYDRIFVYQEPRCVGDNEVFIYMAEADVNKEEVIALLKMRVIENRIAAVVIAPNFFIGAKTNRYKNVQLFNGMNNIIGFDFNHIHGFDSVYEKNENSEFGLNIKFKREYEALI